jgi:translation initiation factor 1
VKKNSKLVYSTDQGRIHTPDEAPDRPKGDGIVRLKRETKGRKGKGVTLVTGLDMQADDLKALCKELKQLCGTGGTVKDGVIEIQGDNRDKIKPALENKSFTVKLAGG